MSVRVAQRVWDHSRSQGNGRLVMLALADYANEQAEAWPSMAALAAKTHLSERTVQRLIAALVDLGEVEVTPGGGRHRPNRYRLMLPPRDPEPRQADPVPPIVDGGDTPPEEPRNSDGCQENPVIHDGNPVNLTRNGDSSVTRTVKNQEQPSEEPSSSEALPRPDVERICAHLAEWVVRNGSKPPTITKAWRDAARLLIDRDGRTEEQIIKAIDWCQSHTFWRANIRSLPKLREQYDALRLQALRGRTEPDAPSTASQRAMKAIEAGRAAQAAYDANRAKGIEA